MSFRRSKSTAILALLVVVAAACGGGAKSSGVIGSNDLLPADTTTGAPLAAPATAVPGRTTLPASHHATVNPYVTAPSSSGGNSGDVINLPPGADPAAVGGTGAYSRVLLPANKAKSIEIQLLEQSGATPNMGALQYVAAMLHKVSGKPVSISAPIAIPGGAQQWTGTGLNATADKYGTVNMEGSAVAVLHWVFVHGQLNSQTLGVATRGDVESIFVDQTTGPSLDNQRVRTAIYTHETGHLIGLVDEVLHEGRADPHDPNQPSAHSPNKGSVMYYALDTSGGVLSLLTGGPSAVPIDFDSADYGDLAKIRAGA
jgi:hypothetical protein